ncbi:CPBP family intramembrane metalloprotease [Staphylococcus sp. ACRSN]|uniref:CPBP family intramembrane glutamic endopeptidase n=1 Tax=Staphylococcus sp. ACRSN TaxID=2918214 RepID=UPI001EF3D20A|nr:type II CAAX endopeptidase family protein [Staphylococcus sp. ACRSN]MCG7339092.1 CPBP family intramembrane metalloprotease [Staphylococcus sp. ACRSN]
MKFKNTYTYKWKDVKWLDFTLPVIYFISSILFSIIYMVLALIISIVIGWRTSFFEGQIFDSVQQIIELMVFIVLFGIWILFYRHSFKQQLMNGIKNIKHYWKLIIVTFIVLFILKVIYPELVNIFAPEAWKFEETENDKLIEQMFVTPFSTILAFFSVVIIAPVTEEFLFRHLLIGELGKKFNFIIMSIISVIIFASLHVTEAKSPLEIVMYLLIAIGIAFVYLKTGKKLSVAIGLHALNNLVAYCAMVIMNHF